MTDREWIPVVAPAPADRHPVWTQMVRRVRHRREQFRTWPEAAAVIRWFGEVA